jgi:copper oxidase (laccase) domain-containing protein
VIQGSWTAENGRTVRFCHTERVDGDFAIRNAPDALGAARGKVTAYPWTWLDQVHGVDAVDVTVPGGHAGVVADACVTSLGGAAMAVQTADCAPVLLMGTTSGGAPVVAAVHAGWRGLYDGVVETAIHALAHHGAVSVRWRLGPCISPTAYEFSTPELTTLALRFGPDVVAVTDGGEPAFDLRAGVRTAVEMAARVARVRSVEDLWEVPCTATTMTENGLPRFYSWRARAEAGRQSSVVWIEP